MAKLDPHVVSHLEWLGFVRPTGLVVSAPALVRAGAILDSRDIEGQRLLRACTQERAFEPKEGAAPYLPDFDGAILFLEDVGEAIYRMDRMLTTLKLAGILNRLRGFVFGTCSECDPGEGYGALTFEELWADHIAPLNIPAWSGAMIGHGMPQWTVPIGAEVEIDATAGSIRMLEPAVR